MTFPDGFVIAALAFAAGLGGVSLAGLLLFREGHSLLNRSLAMALFATAAIQVFNGMTLVDSDYAILWRRFALIAELLQPPALLFAGLALIKPSMNGEDAPQRWRARVVLIIAVLLGVLVFWDSGYTQIVGDVEGRLGLGQFARVFNVFILLASALAIAQFEHLLRTIGDPLRYQLKFVLIGLGTLGACAIYQASRLLLIPAWGPAEALVSGCVVLFALALIAYGLARLRIREVTSRVYISQQVLYGSFTFLGIGLYLLALGVIGEIIRETGRPLSVEAGTLVVFLGVVVSIIILSSRTVRTEVRRFIARHFYRSKYDYRAKWLEVTHAFGACVTIDDLLDRLLELLGRTFGAARMSIWLEYDADGRYHQVRSVNLEPAPQPLDRKHPLIARLTGSDGPLDLLGLDRTADEFLKATNAILCAPIRSEGRLVGFVTLSREHRDDRYGQDDFDLLRAILHHAGMLLSLARLAEERTAVGELEALHRFSAFCLHDIKNLAATLSLVVQNAEVHGDDPAFHRSAMRTVAATVQKMMGLMTKLSLKPAAIGKPDGVDVGAVLRETVASLKDTVQVSIRQSGAVPSVRIGRDQLQQVFLNLLLNAQHGLADNEEGIDKQAPIQIEMDTVDGSVIVVIKDNGAGITEDQLRTLFQPFHTTKTSGLGIGLYQCKRIVEEQGGTIRVHSQPGRGTQVRIELPMAVSRSLQSRVVSGN